MPTKPSSGGTPAIDAPASTADAGEHRQPAAEPGQLAQVAGAGGVVDDADDEEQRRLEQRVRDGMASPAAAQLLAAGADQHDQEAELADRAVGEQQLEVVLPQRPLAADQHGGQRRGRARSAASRARRRSPGASRATR